jgi:hypothetical protein
VATVAITINAVNDAPVGNADAYTVDEGATLTKTAAYGVWLTIRMSTRQRRD